MIIFFIFLFQPGQVKNDRNICIRYYCWNNALHDELLIGCTPLSGKASAAASVNAGGSGIGFGGPYMGSGSVSGIGKAGADLALSGHSFTAIFESGDEKTGSVAFDASTSSKAAAKASADSSSDLSIKTKNEDNGVVTEHLIIGSGLNFQNAANAFTGISGYTPKEWDAINAYGSTAVSADGSASLFHDAMTIIHSSDGSERDNLIAKLESKEEAAANAVAETASKLSAAIVDEGAMCIDESGKERKFGEAWVYASNACETCTCCDSGQVRCTKKVCDPYPTCPEGHYIVEEKADDCCMTYRIVKDDCDVNLCMHKAPKCSFYETLHTYATDDCCATYECVCDPASCPDLGDPACPDGSIRVIIDSNQCCKVGKCVDMTANALASASAAAELSAGGITIISDTAGGKGSTILGSLKSEAAAGAAASANAVQEAAINLKQDSKGSSYTKTIFDAGRVNVGTGANARASEMHDMYYGYPGGIGQINAGVSADSALSYKSGYFENVITKGGKSMKDVSVKAKSDVAAKTNAKAASSQEADVFVSGIEQGGSGITAIFSPGQVNAYANSKAQLAGRFDGYGMPMKNMGYLTGKAAAQSDLSYEGGQFMIEHYDDSGKIGDVKASLKSDLDAEAQAEVSGAQEAYVNVDGGKKGGSEFKAIFHPGQLNAGAKADAQARGDFMHPYDYYGGKINQYASANANVNAALVGGSLITNFASKDDSSTNVGVSMKNEQSVSTKADAKADSLLSLQIADEAKLCVDDSGVERKFGECWYQNNDPCKLCSCIDTDTVECKSQECDPYPAEIEGKVIVEEKTSDCCYSYRYVSKKCDILTCQFQPVICSSFEKMITYAIDECCSTYECVCDEAKCFNAGNPACPEGSTRMVVNQDACCGFGKCVYVDASAAANANAHASVRGDYLSFITTTEGGDASDIDVSLTSKADASAVAQADSQAVSSVTAKGSSKKGSTIVTKYIPGQVSVGSSALAQASSNLGWMGHGVNGGWKAQADANVKSDLQMSGPEIVFTSILGSSGKSDVSLSMLNDAKASSKAGASEKSRITGEIINDEGTCIDSHGKSRCYGEQWCVEDDVCSICTCHDVDQIKCVKQSCNPAPTPPEGFKVVEEQNRGCCASYRVVRETCNEALCQYSAPQCNFNEVLKTYPLDKCCATYECVCNQASCPVLAVLPCPSGCKRTIVDPHACCPVAKCVRDLSISAGAKSSVEASGMFGIFSETRTGGSSGTTELSLSSKDEAKADASADSSRTSLMEVTGHSKGSGLTTTIMHLEGLKLDQQSGASAHALSQYGFGGYAPAVVSGKSAASANAKAMIQNGGLIQTIITSGANSGKTELNLSGKHNVKAGAVAKGLLKNNLEVVTEESVCTDEKGIERYYGETWYEDGNACSLCTCSGNTPVKCTQKVCDPYPTAPEGHVVVEEKADDCCYSYRIIKESCDLTMCKEFAPVCNYYEDLVVYKVDDCCATYECSCNPSKCPKLQYHPCPKGCARQAVDTDICCPVEKCVKINLQANARAQTDLSLEGGQFMIEHYDDSGKIGDVKASLKSDLDAEAQAEVSGAQEAYVNVDGGKKGGSEFKAIFHPGQLNAGAKADARVAGQYGLYDGYFGGKGRLDGAANAASDLSYDGGHFEFISKTGGEGGSKVDFSAKNDLAAKADAAASGSQVADVIVSGDGGQGSMTKMIYVPGKISAGADADAQIAGQFGGYGMPGHYLGHLTGKVGSGSDISLAPAHLEFIHITDGGSSSNVDLNLSSDVKGKSSGLVKSDTGIVIEADICVDSEGRDHKYGETWLDESDKCKSCTCINTDQVQ